MRGSGGKTAHLAALTENRALIVATDSDRHRLDETRKNLTRLGARSAEVIAEMSPSPNSSPIWGSSIAFWWTRHVPILAFSGIIPK